MGSNKKRRDFHISQKIQNNFTSNHKNAIFFSVILDMYNSKGSEFKFNSFKFNRFKFVSFQKSFNECQMHFALSRLTNICNLFLIGIGKYNPNVFKINRNVIIEYGRLQENMFGRSYRHFVHCNSLALSLLDTRSLKRHAADINRVRQLTDNDIPCLTEIQITNDPNVTDILEHLSTFYIYFNSCGVRYQNLTVSLGQIFFLSKHDIFAGISIIHISKDI